MHHRVRVAGAVSLDEFTHAGSEHAKGGAADGSVATADQHKVCILLTVHKFLLGLQQRNSVPDACWSVPGKSTGTGAVLPHCLVPAILLRPALSKAMNKKETMLHVTL